MVLPNNGKLVIFHRAAAGASRQDFLISWRNELAHEVAALQTSLGYSRYEQLECVPASNLIFRAMNASRSWLITLLLAFFSGRSGGLSTQAGASVRRQERWDVLDSFWWPSVDLMLDALSAHRGREALTHLAGNKGFWKAKPETIRELANTLAAWWCGMAHRVRPTFAEITKPLRGASSG